MAALPYIQLYTADYLADTAHLSTLEHGAYLLLIFNYWQRGESFKAKDERSLNKRLASVARLSEIEWESVKENLEEYFLTSETEWKHERIERDLLHVNLKASKASAAGKASAASRSKSTNIQVEQQINGRSTDVQQTLNHTDTDTDTEYKEISTTEVVLKEKKQDSAKSTFFKKPSLDEVVMYCTERKSIIDPEAFHAHYESNGWVVGQAKAKMKCWKSAIVNWEKRDKEKIRGDPTRSNLGLSKTYGGDYDTKNRNNERSGGSGRKLSLVDEAQLAIDRIEERERRDQQEQAKVVN